MADEVEQARMQAIRDEILTRVELVVNATAARYGVAMPWALLLPAPDKQGDLMSNMGTREFSAALVKALASCRPDGPAPADKEPTESSIGQPTKEH